MKRLCILLPALLIAVPSLLHATGHPFTELEIPRPTLTGSHARAVGMGGAHIAVANDASAMTWNPAGLVHVKRIEVSTSWAFDDREIETTWHGNGDKTGENEGQLAGLHFLYPYPTYRGALVIGFGMDRLSNFNLNYRRSGLDEEALVQEWDGENREYVTLFDGPGFLTDSHTREGKLTAWSGAVAWDISPRFSAGINLSYLNGSILDEQIFLTEDVNDGNDTYESLQTSTLLDLDISGYSALGGLLYQASPEVRFGAVIGTPRVLDFERFEQVQIRDFRDDGFEDFESNTDILADETVTFPWFFGFGVSYAARGLMLAGDVRYTDWAELKDEVGDVEEFLKPYYEEETSLSLGGEYLLPRIPLRFRAGYRYEPVSFNLTYCPFDECAPVGRDPAELDVTVDRDRHVYSAGAGYLFGSIFALDAAFETGYYERMIESDPDLYSEKRIATNFIVTGAYRF